MTVRELIQQLERIAADTPEGDSIEVVSTDHSSGTPCLYVPRFLLRTDGDGVRRLRVT